LFWHWLIVAVLRFCPRCKTNHGVRGNCPKRVAFASTRKSAGRGGRAWGRLRKRVFERDDYFCQIHLAKGKEVPVELHGVGHGICDHIIPKFEGGSDDESNLQTICQACDKVKTFEESQRGRGVSKS